MRSRIWCVSSTSRKTRRGPGSRKPRSVGKSQRDKGARVEREIAKLFREHGEDCKRMIQSGGSPLGGCDLVFPSTSIFHDFGIEVKARAKVPEIIKIALTQARVAEPSR